MGRDVANGNFFCTFIRFPPLRDLGGIVKIHSTISERVSSQQAAIKRPEIPRYDTLGVKQDVPFLLRPTFPDVFLVIDKVNWIEDGLLLVFKDTTTAAAYGMAEGSPFVQSSGVFFRLKLEEAMHLVFP